MNSSESDADEEWSSVGSTGAAVILAVCFVVGTPGNLLVVWTVVRHVKQRSHTVLLILHLAVADLLVLSTLPLWIYSMARSWLFGEAACKAVVYIIHVCMYASIFLITIMSVERFLAVRYPLKMLRWKAGKVMTWALPGTWGLAGMLGIPAGMAQQLGDDIDDRQDCLFSEYGSVILEIFCKCLETLAGFLIPFLILAVCYFQTASQLQKMQRRTKPRSMFLIISVVVAFTLCWLPYHVLNIINVARIVAYYPEEETDIPIIAVFVSGALTFISSSVNPMLYAYTARNFQGGLRKSRLAKLFQEITLQSSQVQDTPTPDCSDSGTPKEMADV